MARPGSRERSIVSLAAVPIAICLGAMPVQGQNRSAAPPVQERRDIAADGRRSLAAFEALDDVYPNLRLASPLHPDGDPFAVPLSPASAPEAPSDLTEEDTPSGDNAAESGKPRFALAADTRFLFLSGFVSAREHQFEGNRFPFSKLDADFGENVGIEGAWRPTPDDQLELRLAWFNLRGSTRLDSDQVFNNTTMAGGTTLDSRPHWFEFRLTYLRQLFDVPSLHSSLWLLAGIDYHYIDWRFGATITPTSTGHEPGEDFYVQTFPLPVFGLRYLLEIAPEWSFDLRADAFRANHWRHWQDEGGPIYTSSTIVDVIGMLRWQPTSRFFVEAGYTFNYYTLDEDGPEDGNHLLAREHGPILGVGVSW